MSGINSFHQSFIPKIDKSRTPDNLTAISFQHGATGPGVFVDSDMPDAKALIMGFNGRERLAVENKGWHCC
jgi:hypothetical protein